MSMESSYTHARSGESAESLELNPKAWQNSYQCLTCFKRIDLLFMGKNPTVIPSQANVAQCLYAAIPLANRLWPGPQGHSQNAKKHTKIMALGSKPQSFIPVCPYLFRWHDELPSGPGLTSSCNRGCLSSSIRLEVSSGWNPTTEYKYCYWPSLMNKSCTCGPPTQKEVRRI